MHFVVYIHWSCQFLQLMLSVLSDILGHNYYVELYAVELVTGTTLRTADTGCAVLHSTPRSTNGFIEALSEGAHDGPDG